MFPSKETIIEQRILRKIKKHKEKLERKKQKQSHSFHYKTKQHYHQQLITAPDGKGIFRTGGKKLEFYIKNNLGEFIWSDLYNEKVFQLNFEPSGRPTNVEFAIQKIDNKCVVCGKEDTLTLHHVIPYHIKKLFSNLEKDHTHSWCVLLCARHHFLVENIINEILKKYIGNKSNPDNIKQFVFGTNISQIKKIFRESLLKLEPKYLPFGFLEDQS